MARKLPELPKIYQNYLKNMINKNTIQKLRSQTGAGIMDVKKALTQANSDETLALEVLRKMGQKLAAKKQVERTANEGVIDAYVHANGKVASLILLSCETDFVAKNEDFKKLAHEIAMQVAAMSPQYISADEIPADIIAKEKKIYVEQMKNENKPVNVVEKIITGKLEKFYQEVCLLNQKFIKDDKQTINDLITQATAKLGEKIEVKKMVRFVI